MKKLVILVVLALFFISPNISMINREYTHQDFTEIPILNDTILYYALLHYEIKHPTVVLAQAKLESANFQSSLFKRHNNFLGLYNSRRREYFKFNHWTECLLKYKQCFQSKDLNCATDEEYIDYLLEIGYATDPLYKDKVMRIINNLEYGKEKVSI